MSQPAISAASPDNPHISVSSVRFSRRLSSGIAPQRYLTRAAEAQVLAQDRDMAFAGTGGSDAASSS